MTQNPEIQELKQKALTRDAILSAIDLPTEQVFVPEWGGHVYLRGLTAMQRDTYEQSLMTVDGRPADFSNYKARLVAMCIVDEDNRLVFDSPQALGEKSGEVVSRLWDACAKLSGMKASDIEEGKDTAAKDGGF